MNEKIKTRIKKIIIPLITLFFEIFIYFQMIMEKPELTLRYKLVYLLICVLANIVMVIICKKIGKTTILKLENVFLIITILFGGLYLFFIPAILGTDELPHFLRPYQISVGDIIVRNPEKNETMIPKSLANLVGERPMSKRYSKDNIFKSVDYTDLQNLWNGDVTSIKYSPIPYLPQIIGFWGARILKLSPLLTMFFVRFMNFIVWVVLGYYAIKLLPYKKMFALLLYTCPAVLSLVSTCSGDAFALGLCFLLISYILNLRKNYRKLNKRDYILMFLISLGISTYKMFYVLFILFLFLIPNKCFKNKKIKFLSVFGIFIFSLMVDFGWFFATSISSTIESSHVSKQIQFVLSNIIDYIMIFINTYINDIYYYVSNVVAGSEMCYGLVRINQFFIILYLFILIFSYFDGIQNPKLKNIEKILIIIICLAIFGLVSTTLYLDWTSNRAGVGHSKIIGIQSRYFTCLIIPIIMLLPCIKKKLYNDKFILKYSVVLNGLLIINCVSSLLQVVFPNV